MGRRLARSGALAAEHPSLAGAWAAGIITSDHVDAIARNVGPLKPDEIAAVVAELDPLWGRLSPPAVAAFVARVIRMLRPPPDPDPDEAGAYEGRSLSFAVTADSVILSGVLPRVEGEAVIAAVEAFAERLRSEADHVPASARRADGLVALVNAAHATGSIPTRGGLPVSVSVTLDTTPLGDQVWSTSLGHTLTEAEARFTACDALVTPIVIDSGACPGTLTDLVAAAGSSAPAGIGEPVSAAARIAALATTLLGTRIPWPSDAPPEPRPLRSAGRWPSGTRAASSRGARSRPKRARRTTSTSGPAAGTPTSTASRCSAGLTTARSTSACGPSSPRGPTTKCPDPNPERHPEPPGPPTTTHPGQSPAPPEPAGGCEEPAPAAYPVTAMNTAPEAHPTVAPLRPCMGLELPPGPAGLEVLLPALAAAMDGTGPAIGLLPGSGSTAYRSMISTAVGPDAPVPAQVAVVAATSGSTGNPAGVMLPGSSLRAAARGFAERAGQPEGHRWVAALPLHHAGGLMVAVRSVVAGTSPIAMASLGGLEPFTVDAFAAATRRAVELSETDDCPLAVSLVPPMLALLDAAGARGWDLLAEYDAVLVGGASTPRALVDRLLFCGVHVFTSYGMTETCGGAVFDSRPLPGVIVSAAADGRLAISGDQVALGYRDGRDGHRWSISPEGQRRFRTDDLGRVGPDGLVVVDGRADDVVQVAGASVSLGAVRAVLEADPRVVAAEVVGLPDPEWGCRLVAVVVPAHPAGASGTGALGDLVEQALGRVARPRTIHPVDALPMLESGKVDRLAVLAWANDLDRITR